MPSVSSALRQLDRYAEHTSRYLAERYEQLQLEARHGFTDDPEWYMGDEARDAYQRYGELLKSAVRGIRSATSEFIPKGAFMKLLRLRVDRLRAELDTEETAPEFLALMSQKHADWEAIDVLQDILQGRIYVSKSYPKWNTIRTNRWYHTPFILDEGALTGIVFWVNPQTRLVLFDDGLQLRWRHGRVLMDIKYEDLDYITEYTSKRKGHWRIHLHEGGEHVIDVSWIEDLCLLREELAKRSVKFA